MKHGGNWKKGLIWREVIKRHRGVSRGVRKWLTRAQLITHFGDAVIADAVIARKKEVVDLKNEIRDHPNLPGWKLSLV